MRLNGLAVLGIALNVLIVLAIYYIDGNTQIEALVGVMSGAVTNTPGLAAAQQAVDNPESINIMAMGYAAAYPLGVCGIIGAMFLIKALFGIRTEKEIQRIEEEAALNQQKPDFISIEVTNKLIDGKNLRQIHDIIKTDFVISRMIRATGGDIIIPTSQTEIHVGDKIYVVISSQDVENFEAVIGVPYEMNWEDDENQTSVVSRRILITKSEFNGVTLGSLRLHSAYKLNATRVNRAGVDLLASPDLRLQMGDRIVVVGDINDIERLANKLGNSMKRLNEPNIITIFVGILFGIIVGSINVGFGMKLGLAGGCARGGDIALSVRLQVQAGDLHFVVGFADATRAGHLPVPCVGGYLFRCRICRDGVQFHRYVVGDLGLYHHFRSAGRGGLHCPWGVQDQFPVYHGYVFGRLH